MEIKVLKCNVFLLLSLLILAVTSNNVYSDDDVSDSPTETEEVKGMPIEDDEAPVSPDDLTMEQELEAEGI
jgi:hypothetical protein